MWLPYALLWRDDDGDGDGDGDGGVYGCRDSLTGDGLRNFVKTTDVMLERGLKEQRRRPGIKSLLPEHDIPLTS